MPKSYDMNDHPTVNEPFGTHVTVWYESGPVRAVSLESGVTMHNGQTSLMIYARNGGANAVDTTCITRGWHPDAR